MNELSLISKNLVRNRVRTGLMVLTIAVAFVLYGMLSALNVLFSGENRFSADNRLFITPKYPGTLPLSYVGRLSQVEGLAHERITYGTGFRAQFRDERSPVVLYAMSVEPFIRSQRVGTRFIFDQGQLEAWKSERTGVMIQRRFVEDFGLKVGDLVSFKAPTVPNVDGTNIWTFKVAGVYRYENPDENPFEVFLNYDYFNENRATNRDTVTSIANVVDDATRAPSIARQIDAMFRNSTAETKTGTEDSLTRDYYRQVGDLSYAIYVVLFVAFLSMILAVGNSVSQSLRERVNEVGILKTLGFRSHQIFRMILAEVSAVVMAGAILGIGISHAIVLIAKKEISSFLYIDLRAMLVYAGVVIAVVMVLGVPSASSNSRVSISQALGRR